LDGLENLASLGGMFQIKNNSTLINLSPLSNLIAVNGLEIINNNSLTDLTGLDNLYNDWGNLVIKDNELLNSLMVLGSMNPESIENLLISNNGSLSECNVQSICDYLLAPNGVVEIHDNASGCNSLEEITETCWTSINEIEVSDLFSITPNPNSGKATLLFDISEPELVNCEILRISGSRIRQVLNKFFTPGIHDLDVDLSDLPPGIYFCSLRTRGRVQTIKCIKL